MYKEEVTIKVLTKASLQFPGIDQNILREILERVLYDYDVQPMPTALVIQSDIYEKIALYLATKTLDGLSGKSIYNYKLHLFRFSQCIHKNVTDINTMDLRMFLATLTKHSNIKNTTLSNEISILKSFFGWLEQEDYIIKSPAKKLKQPKIEKRLRHSLTIEELEILKESCETLRERALLEVFYCTGSRLDEIVKLNKDDIDFQNMCVKVIGKGDKERVVYISAKAKIHLQKYLMSRLDDCAALFVTSKNPVHRLGNRSIEREISKIGQRAGFTKSIFPHLIRHTTATLMLNNGADIVTVQHILGHEDVATTQIYAEASSEHIQDQYKKHLIQ